MTFWGNIWNSSKWSPFETLPELWNFFPPPNLDTQTVNSSLRIPYHPLKMKIDIPSMRYFFSQLFLVGNVVRKNPKLPTGLELGNPETQGRNSSQKCATDESNFPNTSVYQNISKYQHPQVWCEWQDNYFWTFLLNILSIRCYQPRRSTKQLSFWWNVLQKEILP